MEDTAAKTTVVWLHLGLQDCCFLGLSSVPRRLSSAQIQQHVATMHAHFRGSQVATPGTMIVDDDISRVENTAHHTYRHTSHKINNASDLQ